MIKSAEQLGETVGITRACRVLDVRRASLYRERRFVEPEQQPHPESVGPPRALSQAEKAEVRQILNSERFQDSAPREVYATLLDEGQYLCSWRTMYRILDAEGEVCERRNQLHHPNYVKPELLATKPNELWSWDITKLLGPAKWTYYYLYDILDVFSRFVVGWMLATQESASLAKELNRISSPFTPIGVAR
jgi:putative transposase